MLSLKWIKGIFFTLCVVDNNGRSKYFYIQNEKTEDSDDAKSTIIAFVIAPTHPSADSNINIQDKSLGLHFYI